MPQSLSDIIVHIVFSTKDRCACLSEPLQPRLHAYLAEVARNKGCACLRVGGVADHVHLAVRFSRTVTVAEFVSELKISSSMWVKKQSAGLEGFAWQRGYGAFSVGADECGALVKYIDEQAEHHRMKTFQEEYVEFLKKHGVHWEDRYVWD